MQVHLNPVGAKPPPSHQKKKKKNGQEHLQPTNCLSVFDHFVGLALEGLTPCPHV